MRACAPVSPVSRRYLAGISPRMSETPYAHELQSSGSQVLGNSTLGKPNWEAQCPYDDLRAQAAA